MALVKGTNSYVTEAEADLYFEDRIGATQWNSASTDARDQSLVTAWQILDSLAYAGQTSVATQPMAWPRTATVNDARTGRILSTSATLLATGEYAPDNIKVAQYELALHLIKNPDIISDAASVTDLSLGSIGLTGISKVSILPTYVRRFLAPWHVASVNSNWFLAN